MCLFVLQLVIWWVNGSWTHWEDLYLSFCCDSYSTDTPWKNKEYLTTGERQSRNNDLLYNFMGWPTLCTHRNNRLTSLTIAFKGHLAKECIKCSSIWLGQRLLWHTCVMFLDWWCFLRGLLTAWTHQSSTLIYFTLKFSFNWPSFSKVLKSSYSCEWAVTIVEHFDLFADLSIRDKFVKVLTPLTDILYPQRPH